MARVRSSVTTVPASRQGTAFTADASAASWANQKQLHNPAPFPTPPSANASPWMVGSIAARSAPTRSATGARWSSSRHHAEPSAPDRAPLSSTPPLHPPAQVLASRQRPSGGNAGALLHLTFPLRHWPGRAGRSSSADRTSIPSMVVAGTGSGAGKTTVALGLVGAFRRRGRTVQTFKVGPDFVDCAYLAHASRRPCRNLDFVDARARRRGPLVRPRRRRGRLRGGRGDHRASSTATAVMPTRPRPRPDGSRGARTSWPG